MFKVKHFMDPVEPDDGVRLWVEPICLTQDLCLWCGVDYVLDHLGPPRRLWDWFQGPDGPDGPDGYDYFRGAYHDHLAGAPYAAGLTELALLASRSNFTLLHQGADPAHNTATALYEFLSELASYCPPED